MGKKRGGGFIKITTTGGATFPHPKKRRGFSKYWEELATREVLCILGECNGKKKH